MCRLLPAAEQRIMPWRNGSGSTAEVVRAPESETDEPFEWRVSVASIDRASAFSTYPDVDRILMPIDAAPVGLNVAGAETLLPPRAQISFSGEAAVAAHLPSGPALCLNVMTRRGSSVASMSLLPTDADGVARLAPGETAVLVALSTGASVRVEGCDGTHRLGPRDALLTAGPRSMTVSSGAVVAVTLREARPVP